MGKSDSTSPRPALVISHVASRVSVPKINRPLPTKDGGTLRTVLDARAYMLGLSKDRERRITGNAPATCYTKPLSG
jgi:hypothetical protein